MSAAHPFTPYEPVSPSDPDRCAVCTEDRDTWTHEVAERLEYLRGQVRAERISWGELAELQGLAEHIPADDVELREWAGVPEHPEPEPEPKRYRVRLHPQDMTDAARQFGTYPGHRA